MAIRRSLKVFLNLGLTVKHSTIAKVDIPAATPHACFHSFICNRDVMIVISEKVRLVTRNVKKIRILRLPTQLFSRSQWWSKPWIHLLQREQCDAFAGRYIQQVSHDLELQKSARSQIGSLKKTLYSSSSSERARICPLAVPRSSFQLTMPGSLNYDISFRTHVQTPIKAAAQLRVRESIGTAVKFYALMYAMLAAIELDRMKSTARGT